MPPIQHTYLFHFSESTGLTVLDLILLIFCPLLSALGIYVSNIVRRHDLIETFIFEHADEDEIREKMEVMTHLSRSSLVVGASLGVVLALYFIGALSESITSTARVLGLAVLVGYQAPRIWKRADQALAEVIDSRIRHLTPNLAKEDKSAQR